MELYEILINSDFPIHRLSERKLENLRAISKYFDKIPEQKLNKYLPKIENYINLSDDESGKILNEIKLDLLMESDESDEHLEGSDVMFPLRKTKGEFWMTKREVGPREGKPEGNPNYVGGRAQMIADKPRWLNLFSSRAYISPDKIANIIGAPSSVEEGLTTRSIYSYLTKIKLDLFHEAFPKIKYSTHMASVEIDDKKTRVNVEYPLIEILPHQQIREFYSNMWISLFILVGINTNVLNGDLIRISKKADDRPTSDIVVDERGVLKISCYSDMMRQLQIESGDE